jgi:hypothetical protein
VCNGRLDLNCEYASMAEGQGRRRSPNLLLVQSRFTELRPWYLLLTYAEPAHLDASVARLAHTNANYAVSNTVDQYGLRDDMG